MQRVMVIGGPGAGKTWLAKRLSTCLGLPIVAIDDLVHDDAGQQRAAAAIDNDAVRATFADQWIIEGGNSRTYAARLDRADWLIHLRPPRAVRLWRVIMRGGATPSLLRWTWQYDRMFGPRDEAIIANAEGRIRVSDLRSAGAVRNLLQSFPCPSGRGPSPIGKAENRL